MNKLKKVFPRILISLLIITIVSSLLLAMVYAKYISNRSSDPYAFRPAAFQVEIEDVYYPDIAYADFSLDGEPGSPLGYSFAEKYYDFSVTSYRSEVMLDYQIEITFSPKVYAKILKARYHMLEEGTGCDFNVYEKKAGQWNLIEGEETVTSTDDGDKLTWTYTKTVQTGSNPDETTEGSAKYRLEFVFYNVTDMNGSNGKHYVFDSDGIEINVSGTQTKPQ